MVARAKTAQAVEPGSNHGGEHAPASLLHGFPKGRIFDLIEKRLETGNELEQMLARQWACGLEAIRCVWIETPGRMGGLTATRID